MAIAVSEHVNCWSYRLAEHIAQSINITLLAQNKTLKLKLWYTRSLKNGKCLLLQSYFYKKYFFCNKCWYVRYNYIVHRGFLRQYRLVGWLVLKIIISRVFEPKSYMTVEPNNDIVGRPHVCKKGVNYLFLFWGEWNHFKQKQNLQCTYLHNWNIVELCP